MKKTVFFLLYLFSVNTLYSQDIEPSQQAQGYLSDKNVSVDHATGIFHYQVPLYTLRSGNYQLPISLNYTAKGVKIEDVRGLIDYNWVLNTGGVVTRTIRGGMADEISPGYAFAEKNHIGTTPLTEDITRVNKRERDGECDIFTAVFRDQTVNFIIRGQANGKFCAEPLERTNVKIECEWAEGSPGEITGWIVTDENGDRYIYRQKEWTCNINKEDAISFNGIRNKSYISSWYLSRIEPLNEPPVLFSYMEKVKPEGEQTNIKETEYVYVSSSRYSYGRPMKEWTFDFSKYEKDFKTAINEACSYLNSYSWELQLNTQYLRMEECKNWVYSPNFGKGIQAINTNFRIMGEIANLKDIGSASNELVQILNELVDSYRNAPSSNLRMAAHCFEEAKGYVIQCLNGETQYISTKEVGNRTSYLIRSPLLKNVRCVDQIVEFQYWDKWASPFLAGVRLCDILKNRISEVKIGIRGSETLDQISFLDKDSVEIRRIKFDYYPLPSEMCIHDNWGYKKKKIESFSDHLYFTDVDPIGVKSYSLRKITFSEGGSIMMDYESNIVGPATVIELGNRNESKACGGIRIKSLILEEGSKNIADTILYTYPIPGRLVYTKCLNRDAVQYADFSDIVLYSRMKFSSSTFLNTGNNGIYYPYVREIMRGKGTKTYLFNVLGVKMSILRPLPYSFWLNGLPLGVAEYDCDGHLKRLIKNVYSADQTVSGNDLHYFNSATSDFFQEDAAFNYNRKLPQVMAYEYYMDEKFISSYYSGQPPIFLYKDDNTYREFVPYEEIYLPNIADRTKVQLPDQCYELCYGGKTLLKEQLEYRFGPYATDSVGYSDFWAKTTGTPFLKTEYFYDNKSGSVHPIRVEKTDSRGDTYTIVNKRVTEMEDNADPAIIKMKQANVLLPVIKQVKLKNDTIIEESVSRYEAVETGNNCFIGLSEKYLYVPEYSESYSSPVIENNLFSHEKVNYLLENTYKYETKGNSYLCVEEKNRENLSTACYDCTGNKTILKAENIGRKSVLAFDIKTDREIAPIISSEVSKAWASASRFMAAYSKIIPEEQTPSYIQYRNSPDHQAILELIEAMAEPSGSVNYQDVREVLDSLRVTGSDKMNIFYLNYLPIFRYSMDINMGLPQLNFLRSSIMDPEIVNEAYFEREGPMYLLSDESLVWNNTVPESGYLKLYIVSRGDRGIISYSLKDARGTQSKSISFEASSEYRIQTFDIDLTGCQGNPTIELEKNSQLDFIVLVPAGTVFGATLYNPDGSVFAEFDQSGQMERYEYDRAGRLIKIFDQNGSLIKENNYHVIL